jgi:hypothetical protein
MAGILANSATATMVDGDTSADNAVSGYITGEQITLTVTDASPASVSWGQSLPAASSSSRSELDDDDVDTVHFTPDVGGFYTITANVDGTTYVLRISVASVAQNTIEGSTGYQPLTDAQVPTPARGVNFYYSSDSGALSVKRTSGVTAGFLSAAPQQLAFDTPDSEPANVAGTLYWYDENLNIAMGNGVVRQLGEELQMPLARNNTGSEITNGIAVYLSGALGSQPTIAVADKGDESSIKTIAIATQDIADNESGYCTMFGAVRGLDTSIDADGTSTNDGDEIFLGSGGGFLVTKPTSFTDEVISLGNILYSHSSNGIILANIGHVRSRCIHFGVFEARPLSASTSYANLYLWSWTDKTYPGTAGQTTITDLTLEDYRDTGQVQAFCSHNQDNRVSVDFQMPHYWAGTDVMLHVHVKPMASGTGDAIWVGSYFFGSVGEAVPAASGWTAIGPVTQSIAPSDQYVREIVSLATCTAPSTPGHSDILSCWFERQGSSASDTYTASKDHGTAAANICIEAYDIHYQALVAGSEEQFTGSVGINPTRMVFNPQTFRGDLWLRLLVKCDAGNACSFRLYDVTGDAAVQLTAGGDAEVTNITSTSYTWVSIGPLSLTSGEREYRIQAKYNSTADEPKCASAMFVVR